MRGFALLATVVLRPVVIGLATLVNVVVVFHWTTLRDIAIAISEELRAAANSEPDDWQR